MREKLFEVIATTSFLKDLNHFFQKEEIEKFEKFKDRLKINPSLGDQLRVPYVREFKTESGKRAYFLVYSFGMNKSNILN